VIGNAYNIHKEWRYIVGGDSLSRYRENFKLSKSNLDIPDDDYVCKGKIKRV
jgi:hypothetical protein